MGTLVICHFGGLHIQENGRAVPLPPEFPRSLFAFLSHAPGMIFCRSLLCETLWPDLSGDRARRALSTALWRLRKCPVLATSIQQPDRSRICFAPARRVWIDTCAFQHQIARAKKQPAQARRLLAQALGLYRAAAFADVAEEWAIGGRIRLENLYCDALFLAADLALAEGHPREAEVFATQLIGYEPFREDVRQIQIKAALRSGNHAQAEHYYRSFAKMLADELDTLPGFTISDLQGRPCAVTKPVDSHIKQTIQTVQTSLRKLDQELSALST